MRARTGAVRQRHAPGLHPYHTRANARAADGGGFAVFCRDGDADRLSPIAFDRLAALHARFFARV
jgi:hypothetical protein